ncbi:MAG: cysteine hydrolase [Chloroflexi bacterium AL-W]|nr:cysteine hydrolase [Chloroflexi bacterium AL-N1]NOK66830.1 cysteine hydrolase [Chloroflexi bacterium AL-N10]NOK74878.1 cysteine hydrolase [Chloroflexi bacterium AL-N5]NOK81433.1 cysteine hydrolase [Chloroflexi bacterium AL-W]NOK88902.1 cysteine hydrolase [Chloroflexi bacterium AL-N15]
MIRKINLKDRARPFLAYLQDWYNGLPDMSWPELIGGEPERVAVISIDVINGFCKSGPLSSERVGAIAQPVAEAFERAYALGVRHFALTQDTHDPDTPEFQSYPPHCVRGTEESEAVDELKALPFFSDVAIFPKNSINSHISTGLGAWISERPEIDRFVIVGDCSDLCTYQAAMHLRLEANANNFDRRVVVPADTVDTYDTPVSTARELGIYAHDGDLHHIMFLHHMAMNGVEVVGTLS